MSAAQKLSAKPHWLENAMALVVFVCFVSMAVRVVDLGYFPQPFFWDLDDTFRDWFSVAIWARDPGAYDNWRAIYPPLSFAFLKFAGLPVCYVYTEDKFARACDWVGIGLIHAIFILNIFLTAAAFIKLDRKTALQRSFAIAAGMPMLMALERGNLVLLCYTCVLLGYGPLLRSARLRWLFVGLAVNFKVYLIAGVLVHALKRRWLWLEGTIIAMAAVYLVSYMIYGAGTPLELVGNLINYSSNARPSQVMDFWYANTYNPLLFVIAESDVPASIYLSSDEIRFATFALPFVMRSGQLILVLAAIATWIRPEVVPGFRVTFFGIALAMITSEASAYTQCMLFFFVFMESWKGWARPAAIVSCYLLAIPGDILLAHGLNFQFSYISGRWVNVDQGLTLGMFVRPLLLLMPCYLLGGMTIRDVWRDIRQQGWRDRWRFRHDWPVLPGVLRPTRWAQDRS